jgi:hypothetical protein
MGYHIDSEREKDLREAYDGPVVSAAPGYSLLDEKQPNGEPQRVIAWRIGRSWTLPVTTLGCMVGEHYVIQPDGRVARCFKVYGSDVPVLWESLAAWKLWLGGAQKPPATPQEQVDDDVTTNVVPFYLPGTDDTEPRPL